MDEAHAYDFSQETFELPVTPYTKYYSNKLISWYGAQIKNDNEHIGFAWDDTLQGLLIYLIFLHTVLAVAEEL